MNYKINDILKVLAKHDSYDPNDDTVNTEGEETKSDADFAFGSTATFTRELRTCFEFALPDEIYSARE